jgi:hypothetical protein
LPELLQRLEEHGALPAAATPAVVERVARLSPATIDRLLRPYRAPWPQRGMTSTKPGTLLRQQVPFRTFAEWDGTRPGFVQVDTVAHGGWSGAGEFLLTLSLVDVATGWVACAGLRDKRDDTVYRALQHLRAELPFPLRGLDSDNGGEFINKLLVRYCADEGITFTRGRPYVKNDNCHVEQKNWAVVRRLVGYSRLEEPALPALQRVHELANDLVNFLQPVRKLIGKERHGARVHKHYDQARTPYRRLLASGGLQASQAAELTERYASLDPLALRRDLEAAQHVLLARAVRSDLRGRIPWPHGQILI